MAIFNSYVSLPEGNNETRQWKTPEMTIIFPLIRPDSRGHNWRVTKGDPPPRSCALHVAIAADREIALIAVTGVATVAGITCQLHG